MYLVHCKLSLKENEVGSHCALPPPHPQVSSRAYLIVSKPLKTMVTLSLPIHFKPCHFLFVPIKFKSDIPRPMRDPKRPDRLLQLRLNKPRTTQTVTGPGRPFLCLMCGRGLCPSLADGGSILYGTYLFFISYLKLKCSWTSCAFLAVNPERTVLVAQRPLGKGQLWGLCYWGC